MPAVKLGRDNTSKNLSRLIYGRVKERNVKLDDLLKLAGVSSKTTLTKRAIGRADERDNRNLQAAWNHAGGVFGLL